jgi:hypothetical protein
MKTLFSLFALLLLRPCVAQQIQTVRTPAPQSDESQAHEAVMTFLRGIRMWALPEGKDLLIESKRTAKPGGISSGPLTNDWA